MGADEIKPTGFSSQKFFFSDLLKGNLSFAKIKVLAKDVLRNNTGRFFVGYAGVMLFLISGIVIMSVNNKKIQPKAQALNLPPLTQPSPAVLTPTPTATPKASLLTPTASPTATPDPTAGWNTYTNTTYGYSIKYPLDWTATDLGQLEPKVPSFVTLNPTSEKASPSAALSITISSSTRTATEVAALKSKTRQSITVNTLTGIKTTEKNSDGDESFHVVLYGTKYVYILVGKKKYESTFNLIYPTFKPL
ncbi:MAG: hypothetical protein HY431_01430 [Candidatus Levybacteria bacterium]|nr:hypothetical protein [Candidatus Levybacteria bacterium]